MPTALITGAGSGIGRAAAVMLAARGYQLAIAGRRRDALRETASLCAAVAAAAEVLVLPTDLSEAEAAVRIVDDAVSRFGRLDVLVNNAGYAPRRPLAEHTPRLIDEAYAVNALAPALAIARAWPTFVRQNAGCIVNLSTMSTIDPFVGFFAYAGSKAAVNLQVLCAAREGAAHNIRAFAVAPGAVETAMLRSIASEQECPREMALPPEAIARVIMECIDGVRDAENGGVIVVAGP
jgi:NAD(P)-dependent dehydrogenase (short-subunit alcohol dehydrogenase family)